MRLLALSDLHVNHAGNLDALDTLADHSDDWLIVAGDVCESLERFSATWELLATKFARLLWVPGNHELWTIHADGPRGVAKYEALVAICRTHGVLTPEDPWPVWPGEGPPTTLVPMFLLYDYSLGPPGSTPESVVAWAAEGGIRAADEVYLHADPYPSRSAWCAARLALTRERLRTIPRDHRTVLINHWPLRADLIRLFAIPRYTPWCGTTQTTDWHVEFRADVVVSGHLHMRATDWRDGVRFEEVALGYPRHWRKETGPEGYLRQILPRVGTAPPGGTGGPDWHR